jgi:hypothetical protein|tara:strand:- start:222 stop:431 length:210 start_codon:yes stop_codon:yes gene_type:complete
LLNIPAFIFTDLIFCLVEKEEEEEEDKALFTAQIVLDDDDGVITIFSPRTTPTPRKVDLRALLLLLIVA